MSDLGTQCVAFPELLDGPLTVQFDEPAASVDGGALLLSQLDRGIGLTERLAGVLEERRQADKIVHERLDLVRQRVYGLGCAYADCNDTNRLRDDPIHKALLKGDPLEGLSLAKQSTLSRFENGADSGELYRMGAALAEVVIEQSRRRLSGRRVRRITIDIDPTADATHGQQQLPLSNDHYDTWCYLPLLAFITFDKEAEHQLVAAILRGGCAKASHGAVGLLRRLLPRLRRAFPWARLRVRLDGGFAGPEMLDFLEEERVEYLVAIGGNSALNRRVEPLMKGVRRATKKSGKTETVFGQMRFADRRDGRYFNRPARRGSR